MATVKDINELYLPQGGTIQIDNGEAIEFTTSTGTAVTSGSGMWARVGLGAVTHSMPIGFAMESGTSGSGSGIGGKSWIRSDNNTRNNMGYFKSHLLYVSNSHLPLSLSNGYKMSRTCTKIISRRER